MQTTLPQTNGHRSFTTNTGRKTQATAVAGLLLAVSGAAILMAIITAEALYPARYTTFANTISDLGGTKPPDSVVLQPSAAIFDIAMVATGGLILAAALLLYRAWGSMAVTIPMAVLGIGVLGVGIFPGNRMPVHEVFALTAFTAGGLATVLSARAQQAPLRYLSLVLGWTTLVALVLGVFFLEWKPIAELGEGGIERWVAYPVVLWMTIFGGSLMARDLGSRRT